MGADSSLNNNIRQSAQAFTLKNRALLRKYDDLQSNLSEDIDVQFEQLNDSPNRLMRSKTIILKNNFEKIIYSHDRQTHYHVNPHLHVQSSLDGIKTWTCVYLIVFVAWSIILVHDIYTLH